MPPHGRGRRRRPRRNQRDAVLRRKLFFGLDQGRPREEGHGYALRRERQGRGPVLLSSERSSLPQQFARAGKEVLWEVRCGGGSADRRLWNSWSTTEGQDHRTVAGPFPRP